MVTVSRRAWLRLLVGTLAVLAGLLLAPSRVSAACGDHVHYGQPTDNPLPKHTPKPCTGPACQQAPALPLTPPVTTTLERATEPGLLPPQSPPSEPPLTRRHLDECQSPPVRAGEPIYHPPR